MQQNKEGKMSNDIRAQIRTEMQAVFPAHEALVAEFYGMQEYHLGWRNRGLETEYADPGKLLRPIMTLLSAQIVGGEVRHALPLAAGIQLLHDFSLIHDDIQDNSDLRRGRETLWSIWGMAQGINAGDGMFILAHMAIQRMQDVGVPAERVLEVLRRFDRAILQICEGQHLDMKFEGDCSISQSAYVAMVTRKTAVLVASCGELGAIAGGASDADAQALAAFGLHLGIAFQMQDDILGIWGDPVVTGKPLAADLTRRKLSLPVIHALAHESADGVLHQLYNTPVGDDQLIDAAIDVMNQSGAEQAVTALVDRHYQDAYAALARVHVVNHDAYVQLHALADGLLGRKV
jgi:geranylgeranyl diphosphate synthase type I